MPLLTALLRLLFPSWAFFDVAMAPPELEVRSEIQAGPQAGASDGIAAWRSAVVAPPRRWWHVLFNPFGTRALARQTLVERWSHEHTSSSPNDRADLGSAVTTRLVRHLAEAAADAMTEATTGTGAGTPEVPRAWRVVVRDSTTLQVLARSDG